MIAEGEAMPDDGGGPPSGLASADWTGAPEADTPTLFERRTTPPTPTPTPKDPAGPASPPLFDGHSGVDHPPSAGEVRLGVPFGQASVPHQLQLGERSHGGVLSTPTMPSHTRLPEPGGTSLRSKSPVPEAREHHADGEVLCHLDEGSSALMSFTPRIDSEGDLGGLSQGSEVCLQATLTPTGFPGSEECLQAAQIPSGFPEGSSPGTPHSSITATAMRQLAERKRFERSPSNSPGEIPSERELLPLTIEQGEKQSDTPLHSVSWRDESHPMWVRIRTVMDSGAADSVAPPTLAPLVEINESPGSRRGQC